MTTPTDTCAWANCRKTGHVQHGAYRYCSMHVIMARATEQQDINDGTAPRESHHGRVLAAVPDRVLVRDLIEDQLQHTDPKIRRAAERADKALDVLVEALQAWKAGEKERAEREAREAKEREAAAAELAEAQKAYEAVVARLNKAKERARVRGRRVSPTAGVRPKREQTPAQKEALAKAQRAAKQKRDAERASA